MSIRVTLVLAVLGALLIILVLTWEDRRPMSEAESRPGPDLEVGDKSGPTIQFEQAKEPETARVMVMDAKGAPVRDARVRWAMGLVTLEGTTEDDGCVVFKDSGSGTRRVWAAKEGYVGLDKMVPLVQGTSCRITLGEFASIHGTVLDGAGNPVAHAPVEPRYASVEKPDGRFVICPSDTAAAMDAVTTDERGNYRLGRVVPGRRLSVAGSHADHGSMTSDEVQLHGGEDRVLDLRLVALTMIKGAAPRMTDPTTGSIILWQVEVGRGLLRGVTEIRRSEREPFEFRDLSPGEYLLTAVMVHGRRMVFAMHTASIKAGEVLDIGTMRPDSTVMHLSCRIEGGQRTARIDMQSSVIRPTEALPVIPCMWKSTSDDLAACDLEGLPRGLVKLRAVVLEGDGNFSDPEFELAMKDVAFEGSADVDLQILKKKPSSKVIIDLLPPESLATSDLVSHVWIADDEAVIGNIPRSPAGLTHFHWEGIKPGSYTAGAVAGGYEAVSQRFEVAAGESRVIELKAWTRGIPLEGSVLHADGTPAAGAAIVVEATTRMDRLALPLPVVDGTVAGDDGRFRVPALPALPGLSIVAKDGKSIISPRLPITRSSQRLVELRLSPGGRR